MKYLLMYMIGCVATVVASGVYLGIMCQIRHVSADEAFKESPGLVVQLMDYFRLRKPVMAAMIFNLFWPATIFCDTIDKLCRIRKAALRKAEG